ncbi:potassium/proton antiporter [Anaeromyxobacter diazotrophicus]|uniref:K+/H+ antiporter n=1 Tax=Anaeromyxobacter diazotrophicus TaxID=2590199 RepID=A0A7I9VHB0_9BACT|nr:potassium/proton antiporter [Anaeromyxobacter diazotrophicus]GEJ55725.1 K+/H+ antiporter [Anaeromyxobacter diazotrophicus]
MPTPEPATTAVALLAAAILLVLSALVSRTSIRVGLPLPLAFLALGMAAGSEGLGGIRFSDYGLAFRLGTVALALILFDGGLNTPVRALRAAAGPAGVLATVGVAGVALAAAGGARLVGLPWPHALVFGAVVSSTDAASVFAVLRGGGIQLKHRVAQVLEVESGLNDPMAVILTFALTRMLASGEPPGLALLGETLLQVVVGAGLGVALGLGGRMLLWRARLTSSGLYPVLTLAIALAAFSLPTLLRGSGFLAVFVAGSVLGERALPHQTGIRRVHDALAWVGQIGMFLVLGLLVFPSRLVPIALESVLLALFLAFVARPLVVVACLAPFRFPAREALYIGWVGLRGAVPIILAVFPVLAGAPGAERIFDVVFFVVVVNALVPGWTVRWLARRIGLEEQRAPTPGAVLEISSAVPVDGEILSFYVSGASAVAGSAVSELPFPAGTRVLLVARERQIVAPKGSTVLQPGDHVHVFCEPGEKGLVQLLFGAEETE